MFGMPLDKLYYEKFINIFDEKIKLIFADNMLNISREYNFSNRGFFKLSYRYIPYNYNIVIENELRTFDIKIYDVEGASNVLNRIEHYDGSLDENSITKSILLLKKVLEENNFNFYFYVDDKLYRKDAQGVKRIKDLKELFNG